MMYRCLSTYWSTEGSVDDANDGRSVVAESFFAALKKELIGLADYATRAEAKGAIFEYIEVYYDRRRLHSTLGYVSPAEYEQTANSIP